jgi:hypothetical protein
MTSEVYCRTTFILYFYGLCSPLDEPQVGSRGLFMTRQCMIPEKGLAGIALTKLGQDTVCSYPRDCELRTPMTDELESVASGIGRGLANS